MPDSVPRGSELAGGLAPPPPRDVCEAEVPLALNRTSGSGNCWRDGGSGPARRLAVLGPCPVAPDAIPVEHYGFGFRSHCCGWPRFGGRARRAARLRRTVAPRGEVDGRL